MTQTIIIDTDPGEDDAIALLLALSSPELTVIGVTAVAGNAPLSWTEVNARRICELAGRPDMPVFAGAERPLFRALHTAPEVHGATGLDGAPDLPLPSMPLQAEAAADFLIRAVAERPPGTVTVCALGPLTNIAQAIMRDPGFAARVKQVVLMGGAGGQGGNSTPVAEFNIYVDPHAADVVFSSGARLVMAPLDLTHQALSTPARIARIRALGGRVAAVAAGILEFYGHFDQDRYKIEGGPLHDPCVIAWLLRPDLFEGTPLNVAVETQSPLTLGQTVIDRWGVSGRRPNTLVLTRIDADGFYDLLTERIGRYGSAG